MENTAVGESAAAMMSPSRAPGPPSPPVSASVVGFTTAKTLAEAEAAYPGEELASAAAAAGAAAVGVQKHGKLSAPTAGTEDRTAVAGSRNGGDADGEQEAEGEEDDTENDNNEEEDEAEDDDEEQENRWVALGERGSNLIHKFYVEEVPEGESDNEDGEERESLAVKVATDQPNRYARQFFWSSLAFFLAFFGGNLAILAKAAKEIPSGFDGSNVTPW